MQHQRTHRGDALDPRELRRGLEQPDLGQQRPFAGREHRYGNGDDKARELSQPDSAFAQRHVHRDRDRIESDR